MNYLLCCESFLEKEEFVWFSSLFHNGLYRIDKVSGCIKPVKKFPEEKGMALRLYGNVVESGRSMVFTPLAAHAIAIYTPEIDELKMVPLLEKVDRYTADIDKGMKFWTSTAYKNKVFLFGWDYPAIVELDMDTKMIHYHTEWVDELGVMVSERKICYFGAGIVRENYVYLPMLCSNFLMRFDMETVEYEWMKVECDIKGFVGVSYTGEDMWLVPNECKDMKCYNIIKWNPKSGEKKFLEIPYINCREIGIPFYAPLIGEKGIYLFPVGMEDVYFIDTERDSIDRHGQLSDILSEGGRSLDSGLATLTPIVTEKGIFYFNGRDFSWHLYNEKTGKDRLGFLEADEETKVYINSLFFDDMLEKGNYIMETGNFSLAQLLVCMKQGNT